jgi:diacylglycerol kinase family enzyme
MRIPPETKSAIQVLTNGLARRLDAGCVTYQSHEGTTAVRHFINIADAGYGGEVVRRVNTGTKALGGLTFKIIGLTTLMGWKNKPMTVNIDGVTHELKKAQQVVMPLPVLRRWHALHRRRRRRCRSTSSSSATREARDHPGHR